MERTNEPACSPRENECPRDIERELRELFELNVGREEGETPTRIKRSIVMEPRVFLKSSGGLLVSNEPIVSYSQVPGKTLLQSQSEQALRINIIRSANPDDNFVGNSPTIACNRVYMAEEHEHYKEPLRDRDKDYKAEKAQILASYDPHPLQPSEPTLLLGKYAKNQAIPPFYWSPVFQSLVR